MDDDRDGTISLMGALSQLLFDWFANGTPDMLLAGDEYEIEDGDEPYDLILVRKRDGARFFTEIEAFCSRMEDEK
jgi:hypothetical protein